MMKKRPVLFWDKVNDLNSDYNFYNETLTRLDEILVELEQNTKFEEEFKEYVILKLITLIEFTLKELVRTFVDKNSIDVSKLISNNEIVKNKNEYKDATNGEIVVMKYNFQNIKKIDYVFSKLSGIGFLDSLKEFLSNPAKTGASDLLALTSFRNSSSLVSNWEGFKQMFEIRSKIAHNIRQDVKYENKYGFVQVVPVESQKDWISKEVDYYKKMIESTEVFLYMCMFILSLVYAIRTDSITVDKSKYMSFFNEKLKKYSINCDKGLKTN